MSETERHDRYKEAQDMAWAAVQDAEDEAHATHTGLPDSAAANGHFRRAEVWALVAIALRRDGVPS